MNIPSAIKSWWARQFEDAPVEPSALPLEYLHNKKIEVAHINCKACGWNNGTEGSPLTEFNLVAEPADGPQETAQRPFGSFCVTFPCGGCHRMIHRFVPRAMADAMIAGGINVVNGVANEVEAIFNKPYDQEAEI